MTDTWNDLIESKKQAIIKELKVLKKHGKRKGSDIQYQQHHLKVMKRAHIAERLKIKC